MICKNCGTELPEGSKFCSKCGKRIDEKKICKFCGKEIAETAVYCNNCGKRTDGKNVCACGAVFEGQFCPNCGRRAGGAVLNPVNYNNQYSNPANNRQAYNNSVNNYPAYSNPSYNEQSYNRPVYIKKPVDTKKLSATGAKLKTITAFVGLVILFFLSFTMGVRDSKSPFSYSNPFSMISQVQSGLNKLTSFSASFEFLMYVPAVITIVVYLLNILTASVLMIVGIVKFVKSFKTTKDMKIDKLMLTGFCSFILTAATVLSSYYGTSEVLNFPTVLGTVIMICIVITVIIGAALEKNINYFKNDKLSLIYGSVLLFLSFIIYFMLSEFNFGFAYSLRAEYYRMNIVYIFQSLMRQGAEVSNVCILAFNIYILMFASIVVCVLLIHKAVNNLISGKHGGLTLSIVLCALNFIIIVISLILSTNIVNKYSGIIINLNNPLSISVWSFIIFVFALIMTIVIKSGKKKQEINGPINNGMNFRPVNSSFPNGSTNNRPINNGMNKIPVNSGFPNGSTNKGPEDNQSENNIYD